MNRDTLYVINPNSSTAVTANVEAALGAFRQVPGVRLECLTYSDGPAGIVSQLDADGVVPGLVAMARELDERAAAIVIACFSDPGLRALREKLSCPVFGIGESAALFALTLGERFGVAASMPTSIPRHLRMWRAMGIQDRFAGEVAIGLSPQETTDPDKTFHRLEVAGAKLRDAHGADVIVMGCAGMASYRHALEASLGIPVVEPSQAAVAMALGHVLLGTRKSITK